VDLDRAPGPDEADTKVDFSLSEDAPAMQYGSVLCIGCCNCVRPAAAVQKLDTSRVEASMSAAWRGTSYLAMRRALDIVPVSSPSRSELPSFLNRRGERLALHEWAPTSSPESGVALLFHGYAAHARYPTTRWLAEVLRAAGLRCYCADMLGHGASDGVPGLLPSAQLLVEDGLDALREVRARNPRARVLLAGQSMGGAVAMAVCLESQQHRPVDGMVLLSPMIKQRRKNLPPPPVLAALRLLSFWVPSLPAVELRPADKATKVPGDAERWDECAGAPQYSGNMRLGTATALLELSERLQTRLREVVCPFFVATGGRDHVVDKAGPKTLFKRARTSKDAKVFKVYPKAGHTLLAEEAAVRQQVEADIVEWLGERFPQVGLAEADVGAAVRPQRCAHVWGATLRWV